MRSGGRWTISCARRAHREPRPGVERVRLPGEAGLRRRREQNAAGVALYPTIMPAIAPWADKLGVAPPAPLP